MERHLCTRKVKKRIKSLKKAKRRVIYFVYTYICVSATEKTKVNDECVTGGAM